KLQITIIVSLKFPNSHLEISMDNFTPSKLKVVQLREELSSRGLSPKGLKKDLVERLEAALKCENLQELPNSPSKLAKKRKIGSNLTEDITEELLPSFEQGENPAMDSKLKKSIYDEQKDDTNDANHLQAIKDEEIIDPKTENGNSEVLGMFDYIPFLVFNEQDRMEENSNKILTGEGPCCIGIQNLVRPFRTETLRQELGRFGEITKFWIDGIKSRCLLSFKSANSAREAMENLNGLTWPPETGKALLVNFVADEELDSKIESKGALENKQLNKEEEVTVESGTLFLSASPVNSLDQIFMKTSTRPHLYYKTAIST
ncbi:hypothetical protein ROZALSC1DRAFT_25676, partial [Rozella allomycis CSF55]